jgi:hypothetical protein
MCIFSGRVKMVNETRIFARLAGGRQHLVYEMRVVSDGAVAMILPLPTRNRDETAVEFVDLSHYDQFFEDMAHCFPPRQSRSFVLRRGGKGCRGVPLKVHSVGAFEASFVPTLADFARLDARFRLPEAVSRQLPYDDFGFAVFQLSAGNARIHPMAFSFETRDPSAVFFPTAHAHDGAVHPSANFDHRLYAQGTTEDPGWERGPVMPSFAMKFGKHLQSDRTKGIVQPEMPVVRRELKGSFPNEDTWVRSTSGLPA